MEDSVLASPGAQLGHGLYAVPRGDMVRRAGCAEVDLAEIEVEGPTISRAGGEPSPRASIATT